MLLNSSSSSSSSSGAKGPSASVISVCGRRRVTGGRRVNVQYILDLLAFAVETGRLTEACAEVVRHIIQHPAADDLALISGASEPSWRGPAPTVADCCGQMGRNSLPYVDEETVSREVQFRKTYNGWQQRATPCGFTPYDKTIIGPTGGSFYNPAAFEITSAAGLEIFGDFDTLEDLLAKLELCRGTPPESIKQAVRVKRELVEQLLRRGGASTRPNVYKRLARALDQRVPPEQRLLPVRTYGPTQVRKQAAKVDSAAIVPSCWHRRAAGSQLFRTPTKLSDFMIQNDQS